MISTNVHTVLKKVLGARYTKDVIQELAKNNTVGQNRKPYSPNMVTGVFCGERSNDAIEAAIYVVYEQRLAIQKKTEKARQRILKQK